MKTGIAIAGFIALGLSPSFMDWQTTDARGKRQIVIYYGVALGLIWAGVLRKG